VCVCVLRHTSVLSGEAHFGVIRWSSLASVLGQARKQGFCFDIENVFIGLLSSSLSSFSNLHELRIGGDGNNMGHTCAFAGTLYRIQHFANSVLGSKLPH
jgi:hypothetical protein